MSTIGLSLIVSVTSGKNVESIGGVLGLPLLWINVPGRWPVLAHGKDIASTMQIGDELKEAVFRQRLQIARVSDTSSIDLYQAYQSGKRFLLIAHVNASDGSGGSSSRATLTVTNAKITQFKRKKVSKGISGVLVDKHHDDMYFSFATGNTKIEYGRDINAVALDKGIGTAIVEFANSAR